MTKDEAILHLTEEQLTFFADRERAVGYREGHRAALQERTWVGLDDEEILAVNMSTVTKLIDEPIVCDTDYNIVQLGKAIEAKLKEKNT